MLPLWGGASARVVSLLTGAHAMVMRWPSCDGPNCAVLYTV
jgi:hypothetical protein